GHDLRLHHDRAVRLALAHLDQAHAAACDDGERLVPAVMRHEDAAHVGRLDAVEPGGPDLDRSIIDVNRRHQRCPFSRLCTSSAVSVSTPFCEAASPPSLIALASKAHTDSRVRAPVSKIAPDLTSGAASAFASTSAA